jgi:membrane-associated protease RseP (regulator of RpoE activity)
MKKRFVTLAALLVLCQGALAAGSHLQLGAGARVDDVDANSPAASAGIKPGDVIRAIDGKPVNAYSDIDPTVAAAGNRPLVVDIDRGGKHLRVKVKAQDSADPSHKILGISHVEAVAAPKPKWNLVNAMFADHPKDEKGSEPEKEGPHDLYHIMFPEEPQGAPHQ